MIWDRRRENVPRIESDERDGFVDMLEHAPIVAMVIDSEGKVVRANAAARRFFDIDVQLPASLIEVTVESRLFEIVRNGELPAVANLVHHRRTVEVHIVPGPEPWLRIMFLVDITDVRRLATVRQEFVANLVHELKTPITSLRLTAESLLTDPPVKDRHRFADRIVREADFISKIIDNLRQLGEIEMGSLKVDRSTFALDELVRDSVQRLGIERPVELTVPQDLAITTDRAKLVQALDNLLDNAAKFSPAGTAIDVDAKVSDGQVVISVRDRGPGISPEHWSRVFERFYKVDRARTREAGGFGLGLAITKHLIQVLGGTIWTEAARDGGQVFRISLPREVLTGA